MSRKEEQAGPGGRDGRLWPLYTLETAVFLLSATLVGLLFRKIGFKETNVVLLYILAVFITSSLTRGYFWGILASVAATLTFNYFFTKPYHSLQFYDAGYMVTFAVMTVVAFVTSTLTSREKENAERALEKERETQALYRLTSRLTEAKELSDAAETAVVIISDLLGCQAACLCYDEKGSPEKTFLQRTEEGALVSKRLEGEEELKKRLGQLHTSFAVGPEFYDWPVYGGQGILGVVRIPAEKAAGFDDAQMVFLHSMLECVALAMDRILAVREQAASQQQMQQERYRGNLLRAISHDLRTPLSGIMGTSEMIMDMSRREDPRFELAFGIHKDAVWLHGMVENILGLTRLQEGRMVIRRQEEAAEEIVGGAVARMAGRAPEHEIQVEAPEEVLMVPMDARLIMQVLINLLDNAVKHTDATQEIRVTVKKDSRGENAVFTVADRGEGIAAEDLPNIFQTFYTSQIKPVDSRKGIGLGLTISESIVRQHGGRMEAHNRTDGPGAEFIFTLPLKTDTAGEEAVKDGKEQYHETILVVEDDIQIRNFICYALKAEGFRCITAGNAATAMKQLLAERRT